MHNSEHVKNPEAHVSNKEETKVSELHVNVDFSEKVCLKVTSSFCVVLSSSSCLVVSIKYPPTATAIQMIKSELRIES